MPRRPTPVWFRLMDKFTVGDGCWVWTASKTGSGYGKILANGSIRVAHRVLYELLVGPVPEGMELDHLCRNPACVRFDHLEPVSHAENLRRSPIHNQSKTHCPQGHEYTTDNTYLYRGRTRMCKACWSDRRHARRAAALAAAAA